MQSATAASKRTRDELAAARQCVADLERQLAERPDDSSTMEPPHDPSVQLQPPHGEFEQAVHAQTSPGQSKLPIVSVVQLRALL